MVSWTLQSSQYPKDTQDLHQEIDLEKRDTHILTTRRPFHVSFSNITVGLIELPLKSRRFPKGCIILKQLPDLPRTMIKTADEKYLILLGYKYFRYKKDIWIVDLDTRKYYKSLVKLPKSIHRNFNGACTIKNEIKTKSLTFGYINQIWKSQQYDDIAPLPSYLITLIQKWFGCLEYVHLIGKNKDMQQQHWTVRVNQILKRDIDCNEIYKS